MALRKSRLGGLRIIAMAGLGILTGSFLVSTNAFADACSDLTGQFNSTLRAYLSSKFQFPEDCPRAGDYFRGKREQAQSLVSVFHAAGLACGSQFAKDRGPPPEQLASLLEHEAVMLETGCNVLAGAPATAPTPQPPLPMAAAPVTAPPSQAQTAPSSNQTAAPSPNHNGPQSCAAQKTMPVAPGCNGDFPQRQTGAACTAADNSVGLTLQAPGSEPTCCVTSCGLSK